MITAEFSASLLQSSVSHDASEIIQICWFTDQEKCLISSMLKTFVLLNISVETMVHISRYFDKYVRNVMYPCWIKLLMYFKNLTDPIKFIIHLSILVLKCCVTQVMKILTQKQPLSHLFCFFWTLVIYQDWRGLLFVPSVARALLLRLQWPPISPCSRKSSLYLQWHRGREMERKKERKKDSSFRQEILTVLPNRKQYQSSAFSLTSNNPRGGPLTSHDLCGDSSSPGTGLWPCRTAYDWCTSERNHP